MRALSFILCALLLTRCSSLKNKNGQRVAESIEPLSIVYSSNRYGTLTTQSEVLKKLGGVHREWNLTQKWHKSAMGETIFLASGTTFVPPPRTFDPRHKTAYLGKAGYIVRALNRLDVTVLSPSAEDFSVGTSDFLRVLRLANFPIVSSNLYSTEINQPYFKPFHKIEHEGLHIYVLGVSAPPDKRYLMPNDLQIIKPGEAIANVLGRLPKREKKMFILLSNLPEKQRNKLMQQFPELHLVLGADNKSVSTFNAKQWTGNTLYLNPLSQGRSLSLIELEMRKPVRSFYNPWLASNTQDLIKVWKARLTDLSEKIDKSKRGSEAHKKLINEKKRVDSYFARLSSIPLELSLDTVPYRSTSVELDEKHELPENELSELIKEYEKTLPKPKLGQRRRSPTQQGETPGKARTGNAPATEPSPENAPTAPPFP